MGNACGKSSATAVAKPSNNNVIQSQVFACETGDTQPMIEETELVDDAVDADALLAEDPPGLEVHEKSFDPLLFFNVEYDAAALRSYYADEQRSGLSRRWCRLVTPADGFERVRVRLPAGLTRDNVDQLIKMLNSFPSMVDLIVDCHAATDNVDAFLSRAITSLRHIGWISIHDLHPQSIVPLEVMQHEDPPGIIFSTSHAARCWDTDLSIIALHDGIRRPSTILGTAAPFVRALKTKLRSVSLDFVRVDLNALLPALDNPATIKLEDCILDDVPPVVNLENVQLVLHLCCCPQRQWAESLNRLTRLFSVPSLQTLKLVLHETIRGTDRWSSTNVAGFDRHTPQSLIDCLTQALELDKRFQNIELEVFSRVDYTHCLPLLLRGTAGKVSLSNSGARRLLMIPADVPVCVPHLSLHRFTLQGVQDLVRIHGLESLEFHSCELDVQLPQALMHENSSPTCVCLDYGDQQRPVVFPLNATVNQTLRTLELKGCTLENASSLMSFVALEHLELGSCDDDSTTDWVTVFSMDSLRTLTLCACLVNFQVRLYDGLRLALSNHNKHFRRLNLTFLRFRPPNCEEVLAACGTNVEHLALTLWGAVAVPTLLRAVAQGRTQLELVCDWDLRPDVRSFLESNLDLVDLAVSWFDIETECYLARNRGVALQESPQLWLDALDHCLGRLDEDAYSTDKDELSIIYSVLRESPSFAGVTLPVEPSCLH